MSSPIHRLRAAGHLAVFTRPELKAERVSYTVITPSAARGIFESLLWKPAIRWHIDRIDVLSEIRWTAFRRNEVKHRATVPAMQVIERGGVPPELFADDAENRAQRNTVALVNVDYVIHAHFEMTERVGPGDNPGKFADMFERRLANGQHFSQPYFGCREFPADVSPVDDDTPPPIDDSRDLGLMLYDIEYGAERRNRPLFFAANLDKGTLHVPSYEAVSAAMKKGEVA